MAFIPANLKLVVVGDRNQLSVLDRMQPTHRSIYQMLDLSTVGTQAIFFQNFPNMSQPFTNMPQGMLTADNAMVVMRMMFSIVTRTAGGAFVNVFTIPESNFPQFSLGDVSLIISNTQVTDRLSLTTFMPPFNSNATYEIVSREITAAASPGAQDLNFRGTNVKTLDAQPVILPNQQFKVQVDLPSFTAPAVDTVYLKCTLEGFGTLAAPNGTI